MFRSKSKKENLRAVFEDVKQGINGFDVDSIKVHLDILMEYGSKCKRVTEFGVDTGCSTVAFLLSECCEMYSYDVVIKENALIVQRAAEADKRFFRLYHQDNLKVKIKKTDLLFIDTDHWYGQIKAELNLHHQRVKKWIMMHDTETFGEINPFDGRPGMRAAISEFLEDHTEWFVKEHFETGHGLTILERR